MKDVAAYIESGILEMYVMGMVTDAEAKEVEDMALQHAAVRAEITAIGDTMEKLAVQNAVAPHPAVKPLLMATLNYMQRLQAGETPEFPPALHAGSTIEDFSRWLNRPDLLAPAHTEEIFVRVIGSTPEMTTAIVWLQTMAPHEVHDHEYEKFLVVEGTCDITIGDDEVHSLVPGDYLAIPLYKGHHVTVTSKTPCKVILQRVAA